MSIVNFIERAISMYTDGPFRLVILASATLTTESFQLFHTRYQTNHLPMIPSGTELAPLSDLPVLNNVFVSSLSLGFVPKEQFRELSDLSSLMR